MMVPPISLPLSWHVSLLSITYYLHDRCSIKVVDMMIYLARPIFDRPGEGVLYLTLSLYNVGCN